MVEVCVWQMEHLEASIFQKQVFKGIVLATSHTFSFSIILNAISTIKQRPKSLCVLLEARLLTLTIKNAFSP